MKLFKIAFLPLLAGILLLPAASRPVRAAGSAAVEAGAGDRKRDKKKKQEADTAAKATPYEKLFKDKRVETVRGGGLTLHLTADKLYLELPDSLLGRGLMITTTIEWTGDPGDGLAHQQPVPPYMVEFGRGKSDTLLCMREFAPVVIVDGSPAMREAVGRSNIGPIVASYAVKARTPDGKSSVVDVTALFVGDVKRLRPIDPEGGNTYGGWMTAKADYKKDRSMLTGVTGGKGCVSVVGELSYGTTVSFLGLLDLWKDKPSRSSPAARSACWAIPNGGCGSATSGSGWRPRRSNASRTGSRRPKPIITSAAVRSSTARGRCVPWCFTSTRLSTLRPMPPSSGGFCCGTMPSRRSAARMSCG